MAYFRCGGGGVPASVKTDMNAVLNKKFGTSTDYPPTDWAPTVNLMGPLPEKTIVSSPIADFSDGADDVPTKSLVVTIPPTLTGVSSVSETQTGRNLFNVADYSQIYTDRDGVDSYNYRYMIIQLKPNTTYTVSQNSGEYSGTPIILINNALPVGGANYFDLRKASDTKTYTTDSTGRLYIGSVNSYDDVAYERLQACKVQIEAGSTSTTYEPYTTPTTYTANLGRTIYGGTADIVNGTGKEQYQKVKVSDLTWQKQTASGRDFFIATINDQETTNTHDVEIDITGLTYAGMVTVAGMSDKSLAKWLQSVRIYDTSVSSVSDLLSAYGNGEIVFYLKDTLQTDFTFDGQEIPTRLGVNNFWSDSGDTEVTYRADIDLLLGGN